MLEKLIQRFNRRVIQYHEVKISNFAIHPGGAHREDGPYSGEEFRDEILISALNKYKYVSVNLDGTCGLGSSFLKEVFGGLLKFFTYEDLKHQLRFTSENHPNYIEEIKSYIADSAEGVNNEKLLKIKIPYIRSEYGKEMLDKNSLKLSSTPFISLFKASCPSKRINGYFYSHENQCNGNIIAFIPFRINEKKEIEVYVRFEATPCWDFDRVVPSSFTRGIDNGMTPEETVINELKEKSGYIIEKFDLISLGQVFGIKSCSSIYYLYGIDLSGKEPIAELTAESELEKISFNRWMSFDASIYTVPDAVFGCICNKLQRLWKTCYF